MADMQRTLLALRDALDDVLDSFDEPDGDIELTITIAAGGKKIPRTRAFLGTRRLHLDNAGQTRLLVKAGTHRLNWDVQGPRDLEYRVIIAKKSGQVENKKSNTGSDGEDHGIIEFQIS